MPRPIGPAVHPSSSMRSLRVIGFAVALLAAACSSGGATPSPTTRATIGSGTSASLPPGATPTKSPTPSPTTGAADFEAELRGLLPDGGNGATCAAATDTTDRAAVYRLKCTYKSLGQTLWLSKYEDIDALDAAYADVQSASTTSRGCDGGAFHGEFTVAGQPVGRLACTKKSGNSWIVWTIDESAVLGEVTRKGDKSKALGQWWRKTLPVGVAGALKTAPTSPEPSPSAS